jgi:hypothetical protein
MIAQQLLSPNLLRCAPKHSTAPIERERARTGGRLASATPTVTAQFLPLDPNIVSDAIAAFFIGRNKEGFWVARDENGRIGESARRDQVGMPDEDTHELSPALACRLDRRRH